jgi:signal transduction histidine kinase
MALRGRIFYGDDGRAARIAGIVIDTTQRKLAEEALRRSEKLAVAGRLAASIAHEINNPLEAVTNALYLLSQHGPLDTESKLYLSIAEQELARVSNIAIQTLRFYRQSAGPVKSNLSDMVDSVLVMYRGRLRSAGVIVYKDYRQTPAMEVLAAELRQVFANLIGNALDAMSRGGTLSIRIREDHDWSDPSVRGIRVMVADTGCGIPQRVLPHIFEPFITTKPATGTGLGLWVSHEIVQKHKGEIRVKTSVQEGKSGTAFSILLPFAAMAEQSSMTSAAAEGAA